MEKWQPKLDSHQQRTFKTHGEQSGFDQPLLRENMEYYARSTAGMYVYKELVSGVHHNYYLQIYLPRICSCLRAWCHNIIGYYLTAKMSPRVCT